MDWDFITPSPAPNFNEMNELLRPPPAPNWNYCVHPLPAPIYLAHNTDSLRGYNNTMQREAYSTTLPVRTLVETFLVFIYWFSTFD
jgi:hypothetical protein